MRSSLRGALVAAVALAPALVPALPFSPALADDRALPMRFELRREGPAQSCGADCKTFISASGAITADSGRDFARFVHGQQGDALKDAVVVLESDGGSVLGAIALGREIRKAALATTVGRVIDLKNDVTGSIRTAAKDGTKDGDDKRAAYSPGADCESMCAFVLLGGVRRSVPPEARVMVHQIWLGDRRDDPTAATYSAEDLVLVQRDIGRLALFTAEMGGSMDLLDLSLRIPPWEPLHAMTREEIRGTKLATDDAGAAPPAAVAVSPSAPAPQAGGPQQATPVTSGTRVTPISGQRWTMVDRGGIGSLARQHPLTVEGEEIGSFDLVVACGADSDSFELSYIERRKDGEGIALPARLDSVSLRTNRNRAKLTLAASERHDAPAELVSYAAGTVPAAMIREFAGPGSHSMVIETTSKGMVTIIRIGNTGARQNLPQLASKCAGATGDRADAALLHKTGGLALAQ